MPDLMSSNSTDSIPASAGKPLMKNFLSVVADGHKRVFDIGDNMFIGMKPQKQAVMRLRCASSWARSIT